MNWKIILGAILLVIGFIFIVISITISSDAIVYEKRSTDDVRESVYVQKDSVKATVATNYAIISVGFIIGGSLLITLEKSK
jgi:hypothetical protein